MSKINQLFCTHCTHGSSALAQRDGELAERTIGYSVRAGSLEAEALRTWYERLEPLLYYHLPPDTPDEKKAYLGATTAPRRFFYQSLSDGVQVCGMISYRPTDSEGRPGSYFAHLIVGENTESCGRWSLAELLRLWDAPGWVTQDSPDIPFKLDSLATVAELLQGERPAIDDALLAHFLRDSSEELDMADPAGVIPDRWRAMEPAVRKNWLLALLSIVAQSATSQREPLLLVAEPSMAALLFYGVARLLPLGLLADWASFSTFEADPDRATAAFAATWHFEAASAATEELPWKRTTLNTLGSPPNLAAAPATKYGEVVLERLLEAANQNSELFDAWLKGIAAAPIEEAKQLDTLAEIDQSVRTLLDKGTLSADTWRKWPAGVEYFRQRLVDQLSGQEDVGAALKAVTGGPAHLLVLDLLTGKPPLPSARRAVVHLLQTLPPEKILPLLKLPSVSDEDKCTLIARYVHAHGTLPPGCEFLWEEWAEASEQSRRAGAALMARVLGVLPAKSMEKLSAHVPQRCAHGFLLNCWRLVQKKKMKIASFTAMLRAASPEAVFHLLKEGGPQFLANYPKNEPALGEKLVDLLRTLVHHPDDFKERLDVIVAGQHLLGDDVYHAAAVSWDKCYKAIQDVGRFQRPDAGFDTEKRHTRLVTACREMAMCADRAMTLETMDAEYTASQKRDFLLKIGQRVLGGTPLLLPGAWESEILMERIYSQFQNHIFSAEPLKKEAAEKKKKEEKKEAKRAAAVAAAAESKPLVQTSRGLLFAMITMIVVITLAVIFGLYYIISSDRPQRRSQKRGPRDRVRQKSSLDWNRHRDVSRGLAVNVSRSQFDGTERSAFRTSPLTHDVVADIGALAREWVVRSG